MKEHFDIHQHITDQIISAIERGPGDFQIPWHGNSGAIMRPTNIVSKKAYRGVNILALWAASEQKGFISGTWGTYRQWTEAGAHVRKGEKSSYVVFYKEYAVAGDSPNEDEEKRLCARATPVFAAEQVEGYECPPVTSPCPMEASASADAFITATGACIAHGGMRAFYRPSTDSIQLPPREAFIGTSTSTAAEAYYSTLLHELTHNAERLFMPGAALLA